MNKLKQIIGIKINERSLGIVVFVESLRSVWVEHLGGQAWFGIAPFAEEAWASCWKTGGQDWLVYWV